MPTRYRLNGIKIDERTQGYIEKKLETMRKFLPEIEDKALEQEVEIGLDKKGKFRVELMVKTPYQLYRSEETTESIEGSIDLAGEEIKRQIKSEKDRRKTLIKRGARSLKKKTVLDRSARFRQ